jgi:hypothetical protein
VRATFKVTPVQGRLQMRFGDMREAHAVATHFFRFVTLRSRLAPITSLFSSVQPYLWLRRLVRHRAVEWTYAIT